MPPLIISTLCKAVEFRAFVVSGFLFALFIITIAGKKIMLLQLTYSSCFIQLTLRIKLDEGKCNDGPSTVFKFSFKLFVVSLMCLAFRCHIQCEGVY